jgi:broad specificity phosphatase PhoE
MIWLVRHGQTEFNATGRIQGAKDSPLTELGVEQGKRIGARLREVVPADARIIASPLGRTQHTARLIREASGLAAPIETDARLAEISLGKWDGMLKDDIRAMSPDYDAGARRWSWFFDAPGGDSHEALVERLGAWLEEARADAGPIVAVSHGVAGRILRGLFLQLPRDEALMLDIPQDAFFRLSQGQIERIDCP